MSRANRSDVIDLVNPGVYHCYSRCVRRAYLCGKDRYTEKDYSHRKDWIEERVEELAGLFAIDLMFFAILSNHFHLILGTLPHIVERWSDARVLKRCIKIFPSKFEEMGVKRGEPTQEQLKNFAKDRKMMRELRRRLSNPSWFLRQLKQSIATRANREEETTGRFFDGPFECKKITDDAGMLIGGMYVDLNEIRAEIADSIKASTHTSAYRRLMARKRRREKKRGAAALDGFLCPISSKGDGTNDEYIPAGRGNSKRMSDQGKLDMTLEDYLELLDWVGRRSRKGKRGKIPKNAPAVLESVGLKADDLIDALESFDESFRYAIGLETNVKAFHDKVRQRQKKRASK